MVVEAIGLAAGLLAVLIVLGLGVTELFASSAGGFQPLLAAAVGLAILELGFEWLTFAVPPWVVPVVLVVPLGARTVVMVLRRRGALLSKSRDLVWAGVATITFFVALLSIVFARGFFTLAGWPSDNIFIYTPSAQYLLDHPLPAPFQAPALENPGSWYLANTETAFPGTLGSVDAALSDITRLPLHALFDPINAMGLALTIASLWFFVRVGLGGSLRMTAAAALLLMTNQFMYWTMGSGFHQEAQALPLFVAGLGLTAHALRTGSVGAGVLAGIVAASLPGLYLPLAILFAVSAVGAVVVSLVIGPRANRTRLVRPLLGAAGTGLAASAFSLYNLVGRHGLTLWLSVTGIRLPAGGVARFPRPQYLAGTVPYSQVWDPLPQALGRIETLFLPVLIAAAVIVYLLAGLGLLRAIRGDRAPEAAVMVAGLLLASYEAFALHYAYGFTKLVCYLAPFTSAFVAYGAVDLGSWVKQLPSMRMRGREVSWLGIAALVLVLLACANSSRDMVRLWLVNPPTLSQADLGLTTFGQVIPIGASVLVDDPAGSYQEVVKIGALVYALPDRQVRVYAGTTRLGTFPDQDVLPSPCLFDFVIAPSPPDSDYDLVRGDAEEALNVYRWAGTSCS